MLTEMWASEKLCHGLRLSVGQYDAASGTRRLCAYVVSLLVVLLLLLSSSEMTETFCVLWVGRGPEVVLGASQFELGTCFNLHRRGKSQASPQTDCSTNHNIRISILFRNWAESEGGRETPMESAGIKLMELKS